MKVLAINGSPRPNGNTAHMLSAVLEIVAKDGFETEMYQAGGRAVRGCLGCGFCGENIGKCSIDDWVIGELYPKMAEADAIIIGSPTYFSDLTPEVKAIMDRTGSVSRRDGTRFARKIGAAISPVRRAGSIHTMDSINHFFLINEMVVPGSSYWNMSIARVPGDFEQDAEGVAIMTRLGENIVWLAKLIDAGK